MSRDSIKDARSINALPLRVTGIVFWGLVVVGLLVVLTMLSGREVQIGQQQQAVADRFVVTFYEELTRRRIRDADQLSTLISQLAEGFSGEIKSVWLTADGLNVRYGEDVPDGVSYMRPLWLGGEADGSFRNAVVVLQMPSVERQLGTERKKLLLGMGMLFVLFGLILQRVLNVLLTRPFQQMVDAARAFSDGDDKVRFDEQRNDEFGYLGGFINRALEYSTDQKKSLHTALERARHSERALQEEKEKLVVTLHSIGDAVITTDERGYVEYMNPVAEELLGWRLAEIYDTPLTKVMRLIDEDSGRPLLNPVDLCLESGEKVIEEGHKTLIRHDGRKVAIADSAAPIRDHGGKLRGVILVFHDVGQARKLARQLSFQASHDPLTGLFNRREFEAQLGRLLDGAQVQHQQHGLCYIDLDQFKVVNDVCGHGAGDELLRQLAGLLQSQVREADILARLGGDEFGVLLTHCSVDQAVRVAENIRSAVQDFRFLYEDRSFEIGASIGVVPISRDSRSTSELLSAADIACYAAKDSGRNRVHLYKHSDEEVAERRGEMNWVSVIRDTLNQDRFYLVYQPIVPLVGNHSSEPSHYELLLRMRDPLGNEVLPMAFLPAAERYNLIVDIDTWVIGNTMRLLNDGDRVVPAKGIFLINLSGQSLCSPQFVDYLESQLKASQLPCERFCFEVAETSAISNLRPLGEVFSRLRAMGCRFALDDFGSGLSSFGYLKNLKIDYIKIDGGFVRDMINDDMDAAMVQAINQIAHVMGVQTIAEFIETRDIFEQLCRLGVDYGQGHNIATPRPIEELIKGAGRQPSLTLIRT
jgi:diguanylate cyclase (GGDEF)-like protein/PAS domain S-box-containing protein